MRTRPWLDTQEAAVAIAVVLGILGCVAAGSRVASSGVVAIACVGGVVATLVVVRTVIAARDARRTRASQDADRQAIADDQTTALKLALGKLEVAINRWTAELKQLEAQASSAGPADRPATPSEPQMPDGEPLRPTEQPVSGGPT